MTNMIAGVALLRTGVALAAIAWLDAQPFSEAASQARTPQAAITRTPFTETHVAAPGASPGDTTQAGACSPGRLGTHTDQDAAAEDAGAAAGAASDSVVARANAAARQLPSIDGFVGARQVYRYAPGALYLLETSPAFVSMLLLEPGESLIDIAAGDTARWTVTQTLSAAHDEPRIIVLIKPQASGLHTNIVLVSDRRTYLVEARSREGDAYLAQMAWCYPASPQRASLPSPASAADAGAGGEYRIRTVKGRRPAWIPARVHDDGRRTWIEFPESAASHDLPPLFIVTPEGVELVNYRVLESPRRYMVDRLFDRAELRVGRRAPVIVRIDRRKDAP